MSRLLFSSVAAGDSDKVLQILKETKWPVDTRDADGKSLLWIAASEGRLETVKLLLGLGMMNNRFHESRIMLEFHCRTFCLLDEFLIRQALLLLLLLSVSFL